LYTYHYFKKKLLCIIIIIKVLLVLYQRMSTVTANSKKKVEHAYVTYVNVKFIFCVMCHVHLFNLCTGTVPGMYVMCVCTVVSCSLLVCFYVSMLLCFSPKNKLHTKKFFTKKTITIYVPCDLFNVCPHHTAPWCLG